LAGIHNLVLTLFLPTSLAPRIPTLLIPWVPVDERAYTPGNPLYHPFIDEASLFHGLPKHMAITKWISFGANQQNPTSPASPAEGSLPLAVAVSSADTKEFGLENVCP
jgi:hypothetical protein